MGRREKIAERISRAANIPSEPLLRLPLVEIVGQKRVLVENHQGVVQYSAIQIGIKVSYGRICVCGRGLKLLQMSKERLVITGCIDGIQMHGGR